MICTYIELWWVQLCNYVETIYYIVGKSFLQTRAVFIKMVQLYYKKGSHYKVGQPLFTKMVSFESLETVAQVITNCSRFIYYKVGLSLLQWGKYYKVGLSKVEQLLQSGIIVAKYGRTKLTREADRSDAGMWLLLLYNCKSSLASHGKLSYAR